MSPLAAMPTWAARVIAVQIIAVLTMIAIGLVILLPFLGTVLWFASGREYPQREVRRPPQFAPWATEPAAPPVRTRDGRSTEQQLADLEREIAEERLRAELARRRREEGGTV